MLDLLRQTFCVSGTLSPMCRQCVVVKKHSTCACINMNEPVLRNREGYDPYFH